MLVGPKNTQKIHEFLLNFFLSTFESSQDAAMLHLVGCPVGPATEVGRGTNGEVGMIEGLFSLQELFHQVED